MINTLLEEEFKDTCERIRYKCQKDYKGRVSIREEKSDTNYGVEHLFEIIFSHLINEDKYGIVLSLIAKKQMVNNGRCIEISVIESDGPIIEFKEFILTNDEEVKNKEIIKGEIRQYMSALESRIHKEIESEFSSELK